MSRGRLRTAICVAPVVGALSIAGAASALTAPQTDQPPGGSAQGLVSRAFNQGLLPGLDGSGLAAGSSAGSSTATPSFSKLSESQVQARQSGKQERMIVVFNNQLGSLPANSAHLHAREAKASSMQAPLVSQLKQVGATRVTGLSLVNSVTATMPAAEASALANNPGVKEVVPDANIVIGDAQSTTPTVPASRVESPATPLAAGARQRLCSADPNRPLLEPEGLTSIHDASADPNAPDEASSIATGKGVIIGNVDADFLAGNPNMIRPDGQHVIIDAPDPTENVFDDEFNGDVATIGAQGTVTYSYASQLPFSNLPSSCTFRSVGDAPGASILTTGEFSNTNAAGQTVAPMSQVMAGMQQAVSEGADVVSESYGFGAFPGSGVNDLLSALNAAMVQAGVVVVEAAGDSGSSGTVEAPADDPNIIDVAGTNDLRLLAQGDGYTKGWEDDSMATLSSGGTTPNGLVVDLVAPAIAALAPVGAGSSLPTEVFGGTSQATPLVAGAAADVIQAYRDTHGGATPTPAQVKEILTSTATDIGAESDQQGAGLVNVYAAVEAARQMPGTTVSSSSAPALVDSPTQLDVQGQGGSTVKQSVTLYNASSHAERVTGSYRVLGSETRFGSPVTENVSAPAAGDPIPEQGATAAAPIHFTVRKGTDVLDADMRWPDPTNDDDNALGFILTDPAGKLAQISYNYGAFNGLTQPDACPLSVSRCGPDIQHSTVQRPMPGTWTAQIVWANGRGQVQSPPSTPGSYTGTVTFQAGGQNFTTTPASAPVTIAPRSQRSVPLNIALPKAPGDAPESVQFTGPDGLESSVPISRRTLIPSAGGSFDATLTSSVSRGPGQIKAFFINVPAGEKDLDVSLHAPDHNVNDPVFYYLFSPTDTDSGTPSLELNSVANSEVSGDATPTPGDASGNASLTAVDPQPGVWEIDVLQGATTDGTEFAQTVHGTVSYNQVRVREAGLPNGVAVAPPAPSGDPAPVFPPNSTSTTIGLDASVPINVTVKNTTNHVASFLLDDVINPSPTVPGQYEGADIAGGNAVSSSSATPLVLAPGATGTLTATLSPQNNNDNEAAGGFTPLAAGDAVDGILVAVELNTSASGVDPDAPVFEPAGGGISTLSTFGAWAYSYTVGSGTGSVTTDGGANTNN